MYWNVSHGKWNYVHTEGQFVISLYSKSMKHRLKMLFRVILLEFICFCIAKGGKDIVRGLNARNGMESSVWIVCKCIENYQVKIFFTWNDQMCSTAEWVWMFIVLRRNISCLKCLPYRFDDNFKNKKNVNAKMFTVVEIAFNAALNVNLRQIFYTDWAIHLEMSRKWTIYTKILSCLVIIRLVGRHVARNYNILSKEKISHIKLANCRKSWIKMTKRIFNTWIVQIEIKLWSVSMTCNYQLHQTFNSIVYANALKTTIK